MFKDSEWPWFPIFPDSFNDQYFFPGWVEGKGKRQRPGESSGHFPVGKGGTRRQRNIIISTVFQSDRDPGLAGAYFREVTAFQESNIRLPVFVMGKDIAQQFHTLFIGF